MSSNPSPVYLPDTNIIINFVRQSLLYRWIETQYPLSPTDPRPTLSIISHGEILALATRNKWEKEKRQRIDEFVARCEVVSLDYPGIVEAYAEMKEISRQKGRAIGDNDLWIAATARVTGTILLTTDKDFDHLHPKQLLREWIDPNTA